MDDGGAPSESVVDVGKVVVGVIDEDMGDGMQCSDHPYRNNTGGICAFCLQEKLGKLVSTSFPLSAVRASTSSSSSPASFRSEVVVGVGQAPESAASAAATSLALAVRPASTSFIGSTQSVRRNVAISSSNVNHNNSSNSNNTSSYNDYCSSLRKARIPFLLAKKKKKKIMATSSEVNDVVFKRSKSTAAPAGRRSAHFFDNDGINGDEFSPRKRGGGFWSFLYHSSSSSSSSANSKLSASSAPANNNNNNNQRIDHRKISSTATSSSGSNATRAVSVSRKERCLGGSSLSRRREMVVLEEDEESTAAGSSFERKVSRSRSVGCGSRSFSGDFFERISTGFGDCTLRRVESQREVGGNKTNKVSSSCSNSNNMKERVKCGGIFGGFIMSSSSSSSSSSSYWVPSSAEEVNGKSTATSGCNLANGRTRSWTRNWVFASPMRAFSSKSSGKNGKRDNVIRETGNRNSATNLAAIPSLLTMLHYRKKPR
ncbi:hypothetical protein LINPERHAP2_LOCUS38592 [Linum perenne]